MADAVLCQIGDAVVSALNGASLSQSFTATRKYRPPKDLKDIETLTVLVVPGGIGRELAARNLKSELHRVDVAVMKQVDPSDNDAMDPLVYLVEEITDLFLIADRLSGYTSALCVQADNDPAWNPEHLAKHRCFTSVIRLYFRVVR